VALTQALRKRGQQTSESPTGFTILKFIKCSGQKPKACFTNKDL
jgi:hypothetical protein